MVADAVSNLKMLTPRDNREVFRETREKIFGHWDRAGEWRYGSLCNLPLVKDYGLFRSCDRRLIGAAFDVVLVPGTRLLYAVALPDCAESVRAEIDLTNSVGVCFPALKIILAYPKGIGETPEAAQASVVHELCHAEHRNVYGPEAPVHGPSWRRLMSRAARRTRVRGMVTLSRKINGNWKSYRHIPSASSGRQHQNWLRSEAVKREHAQAQSPIVMRSGESLATWANKWKEEISAITPE